MTERAFFLKTQGCSSHLFIWPACISSWDQETGGRFVAGYCFLVQICKVLEWRPLWDIGGAQQVAGTQLDSQTPASSPSPGILGGHSCDSKLQLMDYLLKIVEEIPFVSLKPEVTLSSNSSKGNISSFPPSPFLPYSSAAIWLRCQKAI